MISTPLIKPQFLSKFARIPCLLAVFFSNLGYGQQQVTHQDSQGIGSFNKSEIEKEEDLKVLFAEALEKGKYFERSNLDSAMVYYTNALELAANHQLLAAQSKLYGKLGELYAQAKGGVLVSSDYFIKSYDLAMLSGDQMAIWEAMNRMGDLNRSRYYSILAFKYYQAVLQDMNKNQTEANTEEFLLLKYHNLNDLALVYYSNKEYEKAINTVQPILNEAAHEQVYERGRTYQNMACFNMEISQYELAEKYIDSAGITFTKENYPNNWIYLELDRVDLRLKSNRLENIEELLNEIEALAEEIRSEPGLYLTWKFKMKYYAEIGDSDLERKYAALYILQLNKVYSTENTLEISKLILNYEINNRDQKVKETQQNNLLLSERASHLKKTIFLLSFGIVTFFGLSLWIFFLLRKQKESNIHLVKKNLELLASRSTQSYIREDQKYSNSRLDEAKMEELAKQLRHLIEEKKIFLKPDLSLAKLSDQLKVNRTYLSQTINAIYNQNVNQLIASYRVKEAIIMLSTAAYEKYSIAGIGEMCGFGSTAAFNRVFKRETGITPSIFRKNAVEVNQPVNDCFSES